MLFNVNQAILATIYSLFFCILIYFTGQSLAFIHLIGVIAGGASVFTVIYGRGALIGILLGTLIYCIAFNLLFDYSTPYPILLIGILAIWLQAIWTRHLTYELLAKQQWLNNMKALFAFMFKIGPLPSIVSAITTLLLVSINNQTFTIDSSHIFFTSWAGSLMVCIFLTPIILFSNRIVNLSRYKRLLVTFSSILICVAITILFYSNKSIEKIERYKHFHNTDAAVQQAIRAEIEEVSEQLWALAALFTASKEVTADEFDKFARAIYRKRTNVRALEWIPVVHDDKRELFENNLSVNREEPIHIWSSDYKNNYKVADTHAEYRPVYYIYPKKENKRAFGLDSLANVDKKIAMELAQQLDKIVSTVPLSIVRDDKTHPAILLFFPVRNNDSSKTYLSTNSNENLKDSLDGYVVAVVQLTPLFEHIMKDINRKYVNVFIQDVSNNDRYFLYGNEVHAPGSLSSTQYLRIYSRKWQVTVTENALWIMQGKRRFNWLFLLGGALLALLLQFFILYIAVYSIKLSKQLQVKQEELEAVKHYSEQTNLEKSYFLKNLGGELKTPIYAIKYFIKKFNKQLTFEQAKSSMDDISITSDNLIKLVDRVLDIAELESGVSTIVQDEIKFPEFLRGIEKLLNEENNEAQSTFKFHLNRDLVTVIKTDKQRLQQFIIALVESAAKILSGDKINVSIKSHQHKSDIVTILIIITPYAYEYKEGNEVSSYNHLVGKDLSGYSIAMTMVKEVCQLLDGDVKLSQAPNGALLLSSSIKVKVRQ